MTTELEACSHCYQLPRRHMLEIESLTFDLMIPKRDTYNTVQYPEQYSLSILTIVFYTV